MAGGPVAEPVRETEQNDDEHRYEQEDGGVVGEAWAESHDSIVRLPGAGRDGESQDEKGVREHRPQDRGLGYHDLARRQGEEDDEELGEVAESRVGKAGDCGTAARAYRLGAEPYPPRLGGQGDAAHDEGGHWLVGGVVESAAGGGRGESSADEKEADQGRGTNPMRSYMRARVGAEATRAFSAPRVRRRSSSPGSSRISW